jgi:outer membrane protein OmpA-like peptidoglycan-associated protein
LLALLGGGCAQQQGAPPAMTHATTTASAPANATAQPAIGAVNLETLPQTIGLEHMDRVNRFERLSRIAGVDPPQIDQLQLNPGQIEGVTYPIPVVRVIFPDKVLFDFNRAEVRAEAGKILDVIAENMKRDVPDAQLLLLGHTDGIGSDQYNMDLSKRRAMAVMAALVARGVNPNQLKTIPIGMRQPIAPNDTDEGRARNRRVEFMISASQAANVALVERRRINSDFFRTSPDEPPPVQPVPLPPVELLSPEPVETAKAQPPEEPKPAEPPPTPQPIAPSNEPIQLAPVNEVHLQPPESGEVHVIPPESVNPNPLNNEFAL